MKNTVEYKVSHDICTGCGACENICPKDAIKLLPNDESFITPAVDYSVCVNCGKCVKICPALKYNKKNRERYEIFAVRASDEIRAKSSSGGVFTLFAQKFLNDNGKVYGAAFDKNMNLKHIGVENENELDALRGSKYLQSHIELTYREIKCELELGRKILFVGTPCQVAGLYNFLKKDYTELFTIDLLCHGVPSQAIFKQYLKEMFPGKKVINVIFRNKANGWRADIIDVQFSDGMSYRGSIAENDPYEIIFHKDIGLRKSCSLCKFCEFPRVGDISIGDFWGIEKINPASYDQKGTSLVFVNSKIGRKYFFSFCKDEVKCEKIECTPEKLNNRTNAVYKANQNRERFLHLIKKRNLSEALNEKYDVGIVCNWYSLNFGGSLTQYALYHTVEDMGYTALMIERSKEAPQKATSKIVEEIYLKFPYPSYSCAKQYDNNEQMCELNNYCDKFLVGSDQLFQRNLYFELGKFINLDWVNIDKPKTIYAASYGMISLWNDDKDVKELSNYLQIFDNFSVRENTGVEISKKLFSVEAEEVLDPVFLCDEKHYKNLVAISQRKTIKSYISAYILDPNDNKYNIINSVKEKLGLSEEIFSEFEYSPEYIAPLKELNVVNLKVEERLQSIKNCTFLITDSFHGTCFAIIFKKPFIAILNKSRGGDRFTSILQKFHLENRLIEFVDEIEERPELLGEIDYEAVHKILESERIRCTKWLKNALSQTKSNLEEDETVKQLIEIQKTKINTLESETIRLNRCLDYALTLLDIDFINTLDLEKYLKKINHVKERYLICIAVKDTPGIVFKNELVPLMQSMGLRISLFDKHWHSYLAVLDCGKNVYEKLGDTNEELQAELLIDNIKINLVSSGYLSTNRSEIKINGTDYSKDMRGLNFVIYDKRLCRIADSVSFDTNTSFMTCTR